ncbi:MAG: VIT and VWA domain-containing protein [Candidatus Hydrogenedentes bacterium]|nr:VIT and VWA domain-containing protein [Candidatus Hydrogenedentota bacterium]
MNGIRWIYGKRLRLLGLGTITLALAIFGPWSGGGSVASAALPNSGSLQVVGLEGAFCPLEHTDVEVDISGFIARVTLTQRFTNPYKEPIEAVYTFPMSSRGAVDAMTMTIGDRVIKGRIDRREAARRIYEAARAAGHTASLLDQERPNIFTQSVANIMPGNSVEITISYVEYLKYEAGEYEFSFPMVVGPRYNPAPFSHVGPVFDESPGGTLRTGRDPVPDRSRITPPVTPEGTRAGHDISLTVKLNAGVAIQDIFSDLHEVEIERKDSERAVIALKNQKEIPNRDFVLRYAVAGKAIGDSILTHAGEKGNFFTLILQPPDRVTPDEVTPKEMIFVIDKSGSMSGFPIEKAKKTMRLAIERMNPNDTFNLVTFAGGLGYCFDKPVLNTRENRAKALQYLQNLNGGGGTEMMAAIRAALSNQNDPERLRVVCFMTDGFIGNDMAILDAIQKHRQTARVFAFGIGNGVNRFLLENMAREGRGASEIVTLESDADAAVQRFHERIQSPLLTDITIDFGGLEIVDVRPSPDKIPDLFASRPLILTGRYTKAGGGIITVRGKTAAGPFERKVLVDLPGEESANDVLASLWARNSIDELMAQDWLGTQLGHPDPNMREKVTKLGLDYGLVTQFTSFVAVEERVVNEGGETITIQVPVEMTDGVSYEGVFGVGRARKVAAAPSPLPRGIAQSRVQSLGYVVSGIASAAPMELRAIRSEEAERFSGARRLLKDMAFDARNEAGEPLALRDDADRIQPKPKPKPDAAAIAEQINPKLAPELRNLAARVTGASYHLKGVKVENYRVEVFIRLFDDSTATIEALKRMGIEIVSHTRSSKTVFARVRVDQLEKVTALAYVRYVEPARY